MITKLKRRLTSSNIVRVFFDVVCYNKAKKGDDFMKSAAEIILNNLNNPIAMEAFRKSVHKSSLNKKLSVVTEENRHEHAEAIKFMKQHPEYNY